MKVRALMLLAAGCCAWAGEARLKAGAAVMRDGRQPAPGRHWLVQFADFPQARIREELAHRRIRVLTYVPDNSLMVVSTGKPDLRGLPVIAAGPLDPAAKLSPELDREPAGAYLIQFHPDVAPDMARGIAEDQGFHPESIAGVAPFHLLATGSPDRLGGLAARDEVAYILPAPLEMFTRRRLFACEGPITEAGPVADYALADSGWAQENGTVALGYFFETLPAELDQNAARSAIERALAEWARYANVTFTETAQQEAARSINILFASGAHGDAYPFTAVTQLGHTFYPSPPNPEPVAGDMHFNTSEAWNIGSEIDLFSVALHEAGHALGLGHSDNPSAVMYPYYKLVTGLTADDIAGIQALYGPPASSAPAAPTQPVTPVAPAQPTQPTQPSQPSQPTKPSQPSPGGDTTPPSLTILSPSLTIVSTTLASIAFSGTASDNIGIASVQWTTSTGALGTASGTEHWSAQVPLLVGTNVVTVRAYDAAGNSSWRAITVVRN